MQIHVISFTQAGFSLSERLKLLLTENEFPCEEISISFGGRIEIGSMKNKSQIEKCSLKRKNISLSDWTKNHFQKGNCLIFVGAAGIAVREIAPFVRDKAADPAVIVIDENGSFVIPILSGHIGGANALSRKIAGLLGASAVITTASDVNNLPAIDEFAAKNALSINDMKKAKDFAAKMLRAGEESPQFSISIYIKNDILNLIPRCVILGIGCKKGKSAEELLSFVRETLKNHNIDDRSVEKIASIDLKKDEKAILSLAESLKRPFVTFSAEELNQIPQKVSHSDFVAERVGVDNVCERAVFAAGAENLLVPKIAQNGMTLAIGIKKSAVEIPERLKEFFVDKEQIT